MEFEFVDNQSVPGDKFNTVVPEDFRGLYVEKDGNYVLNSEGDGVGSAVRAITKLNKSLRAARAEAQGLKGRSADLSALAEYGDSPESIIEGINAKIDEIKSTHKTKNGEELERRVTKIKEDLSTTHRQEVEVHQKRITALTGQLHGHLVVSTATAALAEAGAIDVDLVLPHLQSQVKVTEEDGKFAVNVVDAAGDPRYSGTTGAPMTIKEAVLEMKSKEKFAPLFKSESHSGGGRPTTQRPGQRAGNAPKSSRDKIAHAVQTGQYQTGRKNA
jgi:hypothetical protein